jgi:transcriptional regulator with XRE-family HTH domain
MGEIELTELINKIKSRRIELGLSYQDLSNLTGISKSTLQRYETGYIKKIPINQIEVLAKALQINPGYLMGWKDMDTSQGWYLDPETAKAAQEMYDKHRVLFDASRKLKPESIKEVEKFIEYQLAKENHENEDD